MWWRTQILVTAVALVLLPAMSHSATVTPEKGSVFINSGDGFSKLGSTAELGIGSQVMAHLGSSATIAYSEQCKVRVRAGQVSTILAEPPCGDRTSRAGFSGRMNLHATDDDYPGGLVSCATANSLGLSCKTGNLLATGLILAGVGAAIYHAANDDPVSP
ncbi:MAG: hypothetical protein ACR2O4_11360 [Hyphomicrobiaceae bacterium]